LSVEPSVAFGLLSALSYGIADYLSRIAGRAVGAWRTSFYYYLVGTAVLSAWLLFEPPDLVHARDAPIDAWLAGVGSAVALLAAVVLFTHALVRGDIAVVVPVTATYGAVTTLLSFCVGERLSARSLAGLTLMVFGAAVVSLPTQENPRSDQSSGLGWALAAAVSYGTGFWLQGTFSIPALGPILPIWLVYVSGLAIMIALHLTGLARLTPPSRPALWIPSLAASLFGIGGFATLALGLNTNNVALVVVLSSLTSAVTVFLSTMFDSTRLRWPQWSALSLIIAGLILTRLS
jgi:drug/metabolite transporter (DMT)-like permease